jgi:hypothetical protein
MAVGFLTPLRGTHVSQLHSAVLGPREAFGANTEERELKAANTQGHDPRLSRISRPLQGISPST